MRLLVTRPENDGPATAARLQSMGHDAVLNPLLRIEFLDFPNIGSEGVQAIIATSANGIRALETQEIRSEFKSLPVLTIGEASASVARQAGFEDVIICGGTLNALAADVPKYLDPKVGKILYLTGHARSGDLVGLLGEKGFSTDMVILYEAVPAIRFSAHTHNQIQTGALDGVLHFSVRTAGIYLDLLKAEHLETEAASMMQYCLSQQIANLFESNNHPAEKIHVAAEPTLDAILSIIGDPPK